MTRVFQPQTPEQAKSLLTPRLQSFIQGINDVAREHQIPAFHVLILADGRSVAVSGGWSHEHVDILAAASMKVAHDATQMLILRDMDPRGKLPV